MFYILGVKYSGRGKHKFSSVNIRYVLCVNWRCFVFGCRDEYDSEGSEVSDDEARPLTRNELQNKVMKTVRKRESAAKKDGYKYDLSNAREMQKNKKDKKW